MPDNVIMLGIEPAAIKFASIDNAAGGAISVVAAVATKQIRVLSAILVASGAVDASWGDGTANVFGGTSKIKLDNTGGVGAVGFVLPFNPGGWFQTAAINRALILTTSAAVGVCGTISYVEV